MSTPSGSFNYFPAACNVHDVKREVFSDYGTPWAVDVKSSESSSRVKVICQKTWTCSNELSLTASAPSRPILPPNNYFDLKKDPCMDDRNQSLKNLKMMLIQLKKASSCLKSNAGQLHLKTFLEKIESLADSEVEDDEIDYDDERDADGEIRKLLQELDDFSRRKATPILRTVANCSRLNTGKPLNEKKVNSSYTGGCLSYLPSNDCHGRGLSGIIIYPRGKNISNLSFHRLKSFANERLELMEEKLTIDLDTDGRIYETTSVRVQGQNFAMSRHLRSCNMFEINQFSHDDNETRAKLIASHSFVNQPTSVNFSPYISCESLISSNSGVVYLWSPQSRPQIIHKEDGMGCDSTESWFSCHFGGHPRLAVFSARNSVSILDIRRSPSLSHDLFLLPHSSLHRDEQIMVVKKHSSPFYHFIATDCSILFMDERFSNHPVLQWNHSLLSPPQYMDLSFSFFPSPATDELLIVGSQNFPEIHCFQFHPAMSEKSLHPQACGNPWKVSMTNDFAKFCANQDHGHYESLIKTRLEVPIVGVCSIPRKNNGVSVLQMTSFGDLFCQDFSTSHVGDAKDKTSCFGPGGQLVTLSSDDLRHGQEWLSEALEQMSSRIGPEVKRSSIKCNVRDPIMNVEQKSSSTPGCCLCSSMDPDDENIIYVDFTLCRSCDMLLSDSRTLAKSVLNENIIVQNTFCATLDKKFPDIPTISDLNQPVNHPPVDQIVNPPVDQPVIQPVDESVNQSVDCVDDVESQLLLTLWNDYSNIDDLLLQRDIQFENRLQKMTSANEEESVSDVEDDDSNDNDDDDKNDDDNKNDDDQNIDNDDIRSMQSVSASVIISCEQQQQPHQQQDVYNNLYLSPSSQKTHKMHDLNSSRRKRRLSASSNNSSVFSRVSNFPGFLVTPTRNSGTSPKVSCTSQDNGLNRNLKDLRFSTSNLRTVKRSLHRDLSVKPKKKHEMGF